ncbi:MAG: EamA family transporter [Bacteroidota bacterium]
MQKRSWIAGLIFLFLCITWGSSFILMKKGLESFSPLQIAGLRLIAAALTLLPFLFKVKYKLSKVEKRAILVVGIVGNGIPAFLFPLAETHISSASAGVLNALSPLFALLLGQLVFQLQFSKAQNVGVFIGFIGAVFLVLAGGGELDMFTQLSYSGLVILATVGYGLSTIIIKRYLNETPPVLATGLAFCLMAVPYGLYLILGGGLPVTYAAAPDFWESLLYVVILGSIGTALAVYLYYRLIQMTDPIVASSVTYLIPVVALAWGLLDGEQFSSGQWVGMGIILLGVYLSNRKKAKVTTPVQAESHPAG